MKKYIIVVLSSPEFCKRVKAASASYIFDEIRQLGGPSAGGVPAVYKNLKILMKQGIVRRTVLNSNLFRLDKQYLEDIIAKRLEEEAHLPKPSLRQILGKIKL